MLYCRIEEARINSGQIDNHINNQFLQTNYVTSLSSFLKHVKKGSLIMTESFMGLKPSEHFKFIKLDGEYNQLYVRTEDVFKAGKVINFHL